MISIIGRKVLLFFIIAVLAMDIILFSLTGNYDVIFFDKSNNLIPIILNISMLILLAIKSKGSILGVIIIAILICFFLLIRSLGTQLFHNYRYVQIYSPQKSQSVIIKYRSDIWNGRLSSYRVYQMKSGFFMKELTKKEITIEDQRYTSLSPNGVFGFETPEWISENTVIFYTYEGPYKFRLKN